MSFLLRSFICFILLLGFSPAFAAIDVGYYITGLYIVYFNRAPDNAGLKYWMAQGANNATSTLNNISSAFAQNYMAQVNYPNTLTNAQFVDKMYKYALSVNIPDVGGKAYWESRLAAGVTRSDLMVEFVSAILNYDATLDTASTASEKQQFPLFI